MDISVQHLCSLTSDKIIKFVSQIKYSELFPIIVFDMILVHYNIFLHCQFFKTIAEIYIMLFLFSLEREGRHKTEMGIPASSQAEKRHYTGVP